MFGVKRRTHGGGLNEGAISAAPILYCLRPPAIYSRLTVKDRLGLHDVDDVSAIARAKLLDLLGGSGGQMLFLGDEVEEKCHDRRWVKRAMEAVAEARKRKRSKRKVAGKEAVQ